MKVRAILLSLLFLISSSLFFYASPQSRADLSYDIILVIENSRALKTIDRETIKLFIEALKNDNCLGIISFEKEAKIIFPLQQLLTDKEKNTAQNALGKLIFKGKLIDINKGLKLALSEFRNYGRKNASKIVLFFSDSKTYPPQGKEKRSIFIKELRENILPAYRNDNIVIYSLAYLKTDFELLQEIAHKTNGKCFFIRNNVALSDTLSLIREKMQPLIVYSIEKTPMQSISKNPQIIEPSQLILLFVFILGLLLTLSLINSFLIFTSTRRLNNIFKLHIFAKSRGITTPSFVKLRDSVSQLSKIFRDAPLIFRNLELDIEDYGAQTWKNERELKAKYFHMLDNLFLLIDYLEDALKSSKPSSEIEWFHKKILRLLEDEGVSEISVKVGERFNGVQHKHMGDRHGEFPVGTIVELSRKGYFMRSQTGKGDIVLRQAEVIISSGGLKKNS
jgi:molecular chaperone GrpE (heat shock protein)